MVAGEIAGRRWQVMGVHRGHAQGAVVLGAQRLPLAVVLEPQDRGAHDPAVHQVVAHPRLEGAQVLADDEGARALRLQREDPDHRLVVVGDVGAVGRPVPLGDPPQPEQAQHVVDPQRTGVPHQGAQHVPPRPVGRLAQALRVPGRLRPVLALLVVLVGGGADGRAAREHVLQRPGVRADLLDADGEVVHDPDPHPGLARGGLGGGHLLVQPPLHADVELDPLGELCPCLLQDRLVEMLQHGLPGRAAHRLRDRGPQGEVLEPLPLPRPVGVQQRGPARRQRHREQLLERLELRRQHGIALEPVPARVAVRDRAAQQLDLLPGDLGEGAVLGHLLDAQVQRGGEAPGDREIGGGLHGRGRIGGVQRVHQQEVRAVADAGDRGEVAHVGEIADAPRPLGADRVQLRLDAEGAPGRVLLVDGEPCRGDHEVRLGGTGGRLGDQAVPAQRQPLRQQEAGATAQRAVEVVGRGVVLALDEVDPAALLEQDVHGDGGAVVDVHGDARGPVLPHHRHRREGALPRGALAAGADGGDVLVGGERGAERGEDRVQGGVRDILLGAVPPPVPGADTEVVGESSQR